MQLPASLPFICCSLLGYITVASSTWDSLEAREDGNIQGPFGGLSIRDYLEPDDLLLMRDLGYQFYSDQTTFDSLFRHEIPDRKLVKRAAPPDPKQVRQKINRMKMELTGWEQGGDELAQYNILSPIAKQEISRVLHRDYPHMKAFVNKNQAEQRKLERQVTQLEKAGFGKDSEDLSQTLKAWSWGYKTHWESIAKWMLQHGNLPVGGRGAGARRRKAIAEAEAEAKGEHGEGDGELGGGWKHVPKRP